MGNQSRKVQINPQLIYQSKFNSSDRTLDQKRNQSRKSQKNIKIMQPGPVIYLPESETGPQLKIVEISDFSSYIKAKSTFSTVLLKETREADYCKEVSSLQIDHNLLKYEKQYRAFRQRQFLLRLDQKNGVSSQAQILTFDYQRKKLQHFIQKPEEIAQKNTRNIN